MNNVLRYGSVMINLRHIKTILKKILNILNKA